MLPISNREQFQLVWEEADRIPKAVSLREMSWLHLVHFGWQQAQQHGKEFSPNGSGDDNIFCQSDESHVIIVELTDTLRFACSHIIQRVYPHTFHYKGKISSAIKTLNRNNHFEIAILKTWIKIYCRFRADSKIRICLWNLNPFLASLHLCAVCHQCEPQHSQVNHQAWSSGQQSAQTEESPESRRKFLAPSLSEEGKNVNNQTHDCGYYCKDSSVD